MVSHQPIGPEKLIMQAYQPTTGMLAWLSSSVLVPPRFSLSMLISSLWSVVAAAAVMVAKIRLGIQVHRPGSHVSVWSGCNVAISPLNDEELANIARHRQAFLAFLRMDCRVKGNLVVGAIGGEARWEDTASLIIEAICAWISLLVLSSSPFWANLFNSLATTDAN